MKKTHYTVIAALALLSAPAMAGDMYKCSNKGVVAYQHTPCTGSSEQTVLEEKKLSRSEIDVSEVIDEGVSLSPLLVKKEPVNSINDQWFAFQVTAINNTESEQRVSVTYKGVDSAGFEVKKFI